MPIGATPEDNLLLQLQGMFAEYERTKLLERSRRGKRHLAQAGAVSVLSGVRPETAQAIVHLGIDLGTLRSRSNLKEALQLALTLVGAAEIVTAAGV